MTSAIIFKCCKQKPKFLVTYSVAEDKKTYEICDLCIKLECFSKFIIKKDIIYEEK